MVYHMHLLLTVRRSDFPYDTPAEIDQVICAELPSPEIDTTGKLRKLVIESIYHSVCGKLNPKSACICEKNRTNSMKCSKSFPKRFQEYTILPEKGGLYPEYHRRDNRDTFTIKNPLKLVEELKVDNHWVVPYNPFLLTKYQAHINVEVCSDLGPSSIASSPDTVLRLMWTTL